MLKKSSLMKNKILLLVCVLGMTNIHAQTDSLFWNREMIKIATPTSHRGWINIKPEVLINPQIFFSTYKQALNLQVNDEMRLQKTETDKISMTHYRYQQYYKGYKVMFAEFMLHEKEKRLVTANGRLINGLNKTPFINISNVAALQKALLFLPASKYAWQVLQLEEMLKEGLHDKNASYKPKPELVWISTDDSGDMRSTAKYELAYMFDIYPASLDGKKFL